MKVTCRCGTVFDAKLADIKRGWGKSCSKRCAANRREIKNGHRWHKRATEIKYAYTYSADDIGQDY